jgi:hypothetical protein
MKRPDPGLDPELEAFLRPRKLEPLRPEVRARALARARATLDGRAAPPERAPQATPAPMARGRRLLRIALAAAFAVAFGAVGAVAALQGRSGRTPEMAAPQNAPAKAAGPIARAGDVGEVADEPPAREIDSAPVSRSRHPARAVAQRDPFTAELELLQRAHRAFTRHDFAIALTLVTEHARRFPVSQLAEQREALRVRSLEGAGRADDAQRAAAAFAIRFPRSVLLRADGGSGSRHP